MNQWDCLFRKKKKKMLHSLPFEQDTQKSTIHNTAIDNETCMSCKLHFENLFKIKIFNYKILNFNTRNPFLSRNMCYTKKRQKCKDKWSWRMRKKSDSEIGTKSYVKYRARSRGPRVFNKKVTSAPKCGQLPLKSQELINEAADRNIV